MIDIENLFTTASLRLSTSFCCQKVWGYNQNDCIEDETGPINLFVWASVFEQFEKVILQSKILMVQRYLQIEKRLPTSSFNDVLT